MRRGSGRVIHARAGIHQAACPINLPTSADNMHRVLPDGQQKLFTKPNPTKMKALPFILSACLILTSCASSGNESLRRESESSVGQKITEGKTTKSEVKSMFGSPAKTSFTDGGLEIWTYELAKMKADAVDYIPLVGLFGSSASGVKKELVVLFDGAGVVKRFSMSESPVHMKTGVFNH